MKKILIIVIAFIISSPVLFAQTKSGKTDTTKHTALYACRMHPDVVSNRPGKCPKCGMALTLSGKEQMKTDVLKNYTCPMHLTVASHDPCKCPICGRKMNLSSKEQMKAEVAKIYTCPMHFEVALDKDGKCPKCGTVLVERKQ